MSSSEDDIPWWSRLMFTLARGMTTDEQKLQKVDRVEEDLGELLKPQKEPEKKSENEKPSSNLQEYIKKTSEEFLESGLSSEVKCWLKEIQEAVSYLPSSPSSSPSKKDDSINDQLKESSDENNPTPSTRSNSSPEKPLKFESSESLKLLRLLQDHIESNKHSSPTSENKERVSRDYENIHKGREGFDFSSFLETIGRTLASLNSGRRIRVSPPAHYHAHVNKVWASNKEETIRIKMKYLDGEDLLTEKKKYQATLSSNYPGMIELELKPFLH